MANNKKRKSLNSDSDSNFHSERCTDDNDEYVEKNKGSTHTGKKKGKGNGKAKSKGKRKYDGDKKRKVDENQGTLDAFFSPPSKKPKSSRATSLSKPPTSSSSSSASYSSLIDSVSKKEKDRNGHDKSGGNVKYNKEESKGKRKLADKSGKGNISGTISANMIDLTVEDDDDNADENIIKTVQGSSRDIDIGVDADHQLALLLAKEDGLEEEERLEREREDLEFARRLADGGEGRKVDEVNDEINRNMIGGKTKGKGMTGKVATKNGKRERPRKEKGDGNVIKGKGKGKGKVSSKVESAGEGLSELDSSEPQREWPPKVVKTQQSSSTSTLPSKTKIVTFGIQPNSNSEPLDVDYHFQEDIFSFDPSKIDTSSWPTISSNPSPPSKSKATSASNNNPLKKDLPYSILSHTFSLLSKTRSRLLITTILTNTLRLILKTSPHLLLPSIYLITNHLAPSWEGVELGIGWKLVSDVVKDIGGVSPGRLKELWNTLGDPGDVAFEAKSKTRSLFTHSPLTVDSVFSTLMKISQTTGQGSGATKKGLMMSLMVKAKGEEVRFLTRTFVNNLRIGAVKLTLLSALARAFCLTIPRLSNSDSVADPKLSKPHDFFIFSSEKKGLKVVTNNTKEKGDEKRLELMQRLEYAERVLREVYATRPDWGTIVPALIAGGFNNLKDRLPITVGYPLLPMLGQITRDFQDVEDRIGRRRKFVADFKYDGQRVQFHARYFPPSHPRPTLSTNNKGAWVGSEKSVFVRLFSRHLEDMTDKYPDLVALAPKLLEGAKEEGNETVEFVFDGEICAIQPDTKALLPFQTLSNRARKDVQLADVKVAVCVFAFDLMLLNGKCLLSKDFRTRRHLLKTHLPPLSATSSSSLASASFGHVSSSPEMTIRDTDELEDFMKRAIEDKCEGVMLKVVNSSTKVDGEMNQEEEDGREESDSEDEGEGDAGDEETTSDGDEKLESFRKSKASGSKPIATQPKSSSNVKRGRRKTLESTYQPDRRADAWLKVKKDYGSMGDSIDVVPLGGWHGQGRKSKWWSPILLGIWNEEEEGYQALCKCMSGFSDAFYTSLNDRYPKDSETCSTKPFVTIISGGSMTPTRWFKPSEVWEIRGADLTLSPVYIAAHGLVDEARGLSLRFPRFIRVREDKGLEQTTTPEQLAEIFRCQRAPGAARIVLGPDVEEVL